MDGTAAGHDMDVGADDEVVPADGDVLLLITCSALIRLLCLTDADFVGLTVS